MLLSSLTIKGEFDRGYENGKKHDFEDALYADNLIKINKGVRAHQYAMIQAYWLGYKAALTDMRIEVKDAQYNFMLTWLRSHGYDVRVDQNAAFELYITRNVPECLLHSDRLYDLVYRAYYTLSGE